MYDAAKRGDPFETLPFGDRSTFGGNTTCVEIVINNQLFICDMGTGVRELGKELAAPLFKPSDVKPSLYGTILQSHVHWDHIQGLPFWAPLYAPREKANCVFNFFGGKSWDSKLREVYRGQMDAPYFPVLFQELEESMMKMNFNSIYDGWHRTMGGSIDVLARKLIHPQETFGYRLTNEKTGMSVAFTTDHEPPYKGLPRPLLELISGVDYWITDCQYTMHDYVGTAGPQKMGWGHSVPEYIANLANEAKPKHIITTHHDPDASEEKVESIARQVQDLSEIETVAAFEGLKIEFGMNEKPSTQPISSRSVSEF